MLIIFLERYVYFFSYNGTKPARDVSHPSLSLSLHFPSTPKLHVNPRFYACYTFTLKLMSKYLFSDIKHIRKATAYGYGNDAEKAEFVYSERILTYAKAVWIMWTRTPALLFVPRSSRPLHSQWTLLNAINGLLVITWSEWFAKLYLSPRQYVANIQPTRNVYLVNEWRESVN